MSELTTNGYLVQGPLLAAVADLPYRGVGCSQPWPLDDPAYIEADQKARKLVEEATDAFPRVYDGQIGPNVSTDLQFVRMYVAHCFDLGIDTRVLLCASERLEPALGDAPVVDGPWLGYDFAAVGCDASLLADDLFGEEIPELRRFRVVLNALGLLPDREVLDAYVAARQAALAAGAALEAADDCVRFAVLEIKPYGGRWKV